MALNSDADTDAPVPQAGSSRMAALHHHRTYTSPATPERGGDWSDGLDQSITAVSPQPPAATTATVGVRRVGNLYRNAAGQKVMVREDFDELKDEYDTLAPNSEGQTEHDVVKQLLEMYPTGIPYQTLVNHNIPCPDKLREAQQLRNARRNGSSVATAAAAAPSAGAASAAVQSRTERTASQRPASADYSQLESAVPIINSGATNRGRNLSNDMARVEQLAAEVSSDAGGMTATLTPRSEVCCLARCAPTFGTARAITDGLAWRGRFDGSLHDRITTRRGWSAKPCSAMRKSMA